MMSMFGQPRAQAGHIVYDGQDITHVPTHEIARLRIAQAPEGRRIFPRMSVMENLQMGADAAGDGRRRTSRPTSIACCRCFPFSRSG